MGDILLIIVLILGGAAIIVAEICTPSFGVLAAAALACFGYAVYRSFLISPILGLAVLVGLLVGLPVYIYYLLRFFPNTPLGRRLTLGKASIPSTPDTLAGIDPATLVGAQGEALTILRPSGTVRLGERRLTARAESGFIAAGTPIKVISATTFVIVVRPVPPPGQG